MNRIILIKGYHSIFKTEFTFDFEHLVYISAPHSQIENIFLFIISCHRIISILAVIDRLEKLIVIGGIYRISQVGRYLPYIANFLTFENIISPHSTVAFGTEVQHRIILSYKRSIFIKWSI